MPNEKTIYTFELVELAPWNIFDDIRRTKLLFDWWSDKRRRIMAIISIAKPGTPLGPCPSKCPHEYCAQKRTAATSACTICQNEIGYDCRFYVEPMIEPHPDKYTHAQCLEEKYAAR